MTSHSPTFLFRCDSSTQTGSGHLMRCLALANLFSKAGRKAEFICADWPGSLHSMVQNYGIKLHVLASHLTVEQDAAQCLQILNKRKAHIVADHYSLNATWEAAFFGQQKVLVLDDLANRRHACNVLLDFNYRRNYEGVYRGLVPPECHLLLGPGFSLLRDEFITERKKLTDKKKKILVFFGGTDPSNETLKLIRAIERVEPEMTAIQIVVTNAHCALNSIKSAASSKGFALFVQPPRIAQHMAEASLFLGSGGVITWERLYMGLPGVVVSVTDNQDPATKALAEDGYQIFLGSKENVDYGQALGQCAQLLLDDAWLNTTAQKGRELVRPMDVHKLLGMMDGK